MISQLDHLNLSISNFDETVAWYRRILGFTPVESGVQSGQRWCILRAGEAMLCLYDAPDTVGRSGGFNHLALRIRDRAALERSLREHQVPINHGGLWRHPHSDAYYLVDPAGNHLELVLWDQDQVSFADRPDGLALSSGSRR